ncbi:hypothetical protein [Streptomyces sp. NRRL WC-3742]|uniref:hypothetical protein n=1 Tax=Streptomyces sp. NRRL WC-3742 TaxID=1463934 RepID=UPI001F2E958A|nr:hypothetical protein [Streptomyces sp. NRRL WC-3742]
MNVVASVCDECGGRRFHVVVDDEQGAAGRVCCACGNPAYIADSEEVWEEADPGTACCPCGGEEFEVAVGFELGGDGSVRWVTVGLRCQKDGQPGIYVDRKIDYAPTDHLLSLA